MVATGTPAGIDDGGDGDADGDRQQKSGIDRER